MSEDTENKAPMPPLHIPPELKDDTADDWTGNPPQEEAPVEAAKSLEDVAREVIRGDWGHGQERRIALANAGHDPNKVKDEVVRFLNSRP